MSATSHKPLSILQHRRDFLAIAQSGKKFAAPGLILQIGRKSQDETRDAQRYGLVASGKIGSAVVRNRAKRRLRALANEIFPLHAMTGCDYVLIARAVTPKRRYEDLRQDLISALKKLGAWRE